MSYPSNFSNKPFNNLFGDFGTMANTPLVDPEGLVYVDAYNRNHQTYLPDAPILHSDECNVPVTCDTRWLSDGNQVGTVNPTCATFDKVVKFDGMCKDSGNTWDNDKVVPLQKKNGCPAYFKARVYDDPDDHGYLAINMRTLQICSKCGDGPEHCLTADQTTTDPQYPSYYRRMARYEHL